MSAVQSIPAPVHSVFEGISQAHRQPLLEVRDLIFQVAGRDPRIGQIEETLRWGEPAYVTSKGKTGSTIRLSIEKASGMPAIFFNCQTSLVEEFRQQFGSSLRYSKNRSIILDDDIGALSAALKSCIAAALTYHLSDKRAPATGATETQA